MNRKRWFSILVVCCFLCLMPAGMALAKAEALRPSPVKPRHTQITDHVHPDRVIVKFQEGSDARLRGSALVSSSGSLASLQNILKTFSGLKIERLFSRSEQELSEDKVKGEKLTGKTLADLNLYFHLKMDSTIQAQQVESLIDSLNALNIVEIAYPEPIAEEARADISPVTPNFESLQGYLNPAPVGVDALYARTIPGGKGENTRFIDVEYGWRTAHEDLKDPFFMPANLYIDEHGTAVLGEIIGEQNGFGITGIAPLAAFGGSSIVTRPVSDAISLAAANLSYGDVILIELHSKGPILPMACSCNAGQCQYIPMEYWQDNFDAIQTASANGVIVVEAGGNGSMNLDDPIYGGAFDRRYRDSGAIMVGASSSNGGIPTCWTNNGSRVDVHGWGENVVTTGYGDLFAGGSGKNEDPNQYYTQVFSGTSSASPIIVGSVLSVQGKKKQGGAPLNAYQMRALLSYTGTPQAADPKHIGPLPDLKKAFQLNMADTDNDGILDIFETGTGVYIDPTNTGTSSAIADSDGDGLSDGAEVYVYHTNPNMADTDGDGVPDNADNCPTVSNPTQSDSNGNGVGDACDCKGPQKRYYLDADGDGYGVSACSDSSCMAYLCQPAPHWVLDHTDCNDSNASINPGASEICGDGIDNDCDGRIDLTLYYRDADGDGYGIYNDTLTTACIPSPGYALKSGDCNDANPNINPGMSEGAYANGIDDNCDGLIDWDPPQVIETIAAAMYHPDIAMNGKGDAMAVWFQSSSFVILSNRYVAGSGWQTPQVIDPLATYAVLPRVVMDSAGNAVAIYEKYDSLLGQGDLLASTYSPASGWGTPQRIETDNSGSIINKDIAMDASGTAIALWILSDNVNYKVMANRFVPGTGWETAQIIKSGLLSNGISDYLPEVAMDGHGNAMAIWRDDNKFIVWASRYVAGSGWGTPVQLETAGGSKEPQIAMDASGNALAVWHAWDRSGVAHIYANRYIAGSGWQGAQLIETNTIGFEIPRLAMNANGDAVVVWQEWYGDNNSGNLRNIWAKRYVPGSGWQTEQMIRLYPYQGATSDHQVAIDPAGNAVAVWHEFFSGALGDSVWACRYNAGSGWQAAQQIKTDLSRTYDSDMYYPRVAMDAAGTAITVWSSGSGPDIWASRSLATAPFSDRDNDGIPDTSDNCPNTYNPDQADCNKNGIGDACDSAYAEVCNDGIDNDCDGLIDAADPDCQPVITTSSLPAATASIPYSQQLTAAGGVTPYTWAKVSGNLPNGLSLNSAGLISGTPTTMGIYPFTVQVTDAMSLTATKSLSISVRWIDLVISSVSGPSMGALGGSVVLEFTVCNQGTGSVPISTYFYNFSYYSLDTSITTTDTFLGWVAFNGLAAGECRTQYMNWSISTSTVPGVYYFGAIADLYNQVPETDETNNATTGNAITISADPCADAATRCNDNNTCTIDACDPVTYACVHSAVICQTGYLCENGKGCVPTACTVRTVGTDCSDNNACTINDKCIAKKSGKTTIYVCQGTAVTNGTTCNDNNACTSGDVCTNGACIGTVKICNDNNACTTDSCNTTTGACEFKTVVCDDNNICTQPDHCDPLIGCVYPPFDGAYCKYGNRTGICRNGVCSR